MRRPPRIAEALATLLIPPACREEVLGDLQERCTSTRGYFKDVVIAVPCVIASRMRRITDPPVLLLQAMLVYLAFLGAAWIVNGTPPFDRWEIWLLAIPAACVLAGSILADIYAEPGAPSPWRPVKGPVLGAALAFLSRSAFPNAVPFRIVLSGAAFSLILASTANLLIPPVIGRPQGVNGPALWLKHSSAPLGSLKWIAVPAVIILVAALSGLRLRAVQTASLTAAIIVAYHMLKRI